MDDLEDYDDEFEFEESLDSMEEEQPAEKSVANAPVPEYEASAANADLLEESEDDDYGSDFSDEFEEEEESQSQERVSARPAGATIAPKIETIPQMPNESDDDDEDEYSAPNYTSKAVTGRQEQSEEDDAYSDDEYYVAAPTRDDADTFLTETSIPVATGSMPWENQSTSTTQQSKPKSIQGLQKENLNLREKLKQMSTHLNELIERQQSDRLHVSTLGRERVRAGELHNTKKQLQIYQREKAKLETRLNKLQGTDYLFRIKSDTDKTQQNIRNMEQEIRVLKKDQRIREKELEGLDGTNENPAMIKQINEKTSEHVVASEKLIVQERKAAKMLAQFQVQKGTLDKLEEKYEKVLAIMKPYKQQIKDRKRNNKKQARLRKQYNKLQMELRIRQHAQSSDQSKLRNTEAQNRQRLETTMRQKRDIQSLTESYQNRIDRYRAEIESISGQNQSFTRAEEVYEGNPIDSCQSTYGYNSTIKEMAAEYEETTTQVPYTGWEGRGPSRGSVKPTMNFHITESDEDKEFEREQVTLPEPVELRSPRTQPKFAQRPFDFKQSLDLKKVEPPAPVQQMPERVVKSIPIMTSGPTETQAPTVAAISTQISENPAVQPSSSIQPSSDRLRIREEYPSDPSPGRLRTIEEKPSDPTPGRLRPIEENPPEPSPARLRPREEKAPEPSPVRLRPREEKAPEPSPVRLRPREDTSPARNDFNTVNNPNPADTPMWMKATEETAPTTNPAEAPMWMKSTEETATTKIEPQLSTKRVRATEVDTPLWMQSETSEPTAQPSAAGTQDNIPLWMRTEGETIESPAMKPPQPQLSSNRLRAPIESNSSRLNQSNDSGPAPIAPRKSPLRQAEGNMFTQSPMKSVEGDLFSKQPAAPVRQAEGDFFSKAPSQPVFSKGLFSAADPSPRPNEGNLFSVNSSERRLEPDRPTPFQPFNDAKPFNQPDAPIKMTSQAQMINDLDEEDLLL